VPRHQNFRIFSTYEPNTNYFQPSKATLNRAIKIFVDGNKMALEIIDAENHGEFTQKIKELMEFLLTTDKNIFKQ
jgi:hypothetical protein